MRAPQNKWPDTDGARGVLLFAQSMRDMLNPNTFESFRVYSLDTIARLHEASKLFHYLRETGINIATIDPVLEELAWSFEKDGVAQRLAGKEIESFRKVALNSNCKIKSENIDDIEHHITLIKKIISDNYKSELELDLKSIIKDKNNRNDIRKLSGHYCSHLINMGYSRQYISKTTKDHFFTEDKARVGALSLNSFFKLFDTKSKRYTVSVAINDEFHRFLSGIGYNVVKSRNIPIELKSSFSKNKNNVNLTSAVSIQVEALDEDRAVEYTYQRIFSERAITYLDPIGVKCDWGEVMHVKATRTKTASSIEKSDFLTSSTNSNKTISGRRFRNLIRYSRRILSSFDENSTERIASSINTAALARNSTNPENQLISFWSSFEVLLSNPRPSQVRIIHYAKLICPCISIRHVNRQMHALFEELFILYRKRFQKLIFQIPRNNTHPGVPEFAKLLLLPEHQPYREELCKIVSDSPLALQRLNKIHNDYKSRDRVFKSLESHNKRVEWQIYRIYRARNHLVHSGITPSYMESIILNLVEYYSTAMATIVNRAKKEEANSDIDEIVNEISIMYGIMLDNFRSKQNGSQINETDIELLLRPLHA